MRRLRTFAGVATVVAFATLAASSPAVGATRGLSTISGVIAPKTADKSPQVRVNQVGYPADAQKVAFAMLPRPVSRVSFEVVTPYGVAYRGTSTDDLGSWNSGYRAVYQLSFSGVDTPGRYQVKLLSPASAISPAFIIGDGAQLYRQLVDNAVQYFTSERDGPDVDSAVLNRQPANLTDEHAYAYADPKYDSNDNLLGSFRKIGGPVDVSGGWFDAGGGYEKFAYTASYSDALMLIAARDFPGSYPALLPEADFGLQWITRLWNPVRKVLYAQVGIGNGSRRLRGQRGLLALGRTRRRLHRQLPAGLRPGRGWPWLTIRCCPGRSRGLCGPPCWPSTGATSRPTWPSWPPTARCSPQPAAPASTPMKSASTRRC
jgi:endoglucanase